MDTQKSPELFVLPALILFSRSLPTQTITFTWANLTS